MSAQPDYFSAFPAQIPALRAACEAWRGTPFRQNSLVPGPAGGVDCAGFVGAVFFAIGAIPEAIAVPPYALNHAEHSPDSVLRAWLERPAARARVRLLDEAEAHHDGDMVFPRVGRSEHHLALRIGDDLYQIARPSGWCCLRLTQVSLHRARYRLLVESFHPDVLPR